MGRGPENTTIVPVEEIMAYVPGGVLNSVSLQETRDGRLGAVIPEKGRGRYSLPNAIKRKAFFESGQPDSLTARRQWNASNRLYPKRK